MFSSPAGCVLSGPEMPAKAMPEVRPGQNRRCRRKRNRETSSGRTAWPRQRPAGREIRRETPEVRIRRARVPSICG